MDCASTTYYIQLLQVIKCIQVTSKFFICINTIQESVWTLKCYSDSDYGGDTEKRKSVTGWSININGNIIACGSRQQKNITTEKTVYKIGLYLGTETGTVFLFSREVLGLLTHQVWKGWAIAHCWIIR